MWHTGMRMRTLACGKPRSWRCTCRTWPRSCPSTSSTARRSLKCARPTSTRVYNAFRNLLSLLSARLTDSINHHYNQVPPCARPSPSTPISTSSCAWATTALMKVLSFSRSLSSRGLISISRLTTHLSLSLSPDMFCALDTMVREDEDKMIYTCTVGRYTYE